VNDVADDLAALDRRFLSFIAWHGEVPCEAKQLAEPEEARERATAWIRQQYTGDFKLHGHVRAYQLGEPWWTVLFERAGEGDAPENAENWWIEAYAHNDHTGPSGAQIRHNAATKVRNRCR
jgi:hypothetical protein